MKKVWIDTDVAIGVGNPQDGYADVDDAYAIIHLLKAPEIKVMGISTVFGNTDVDQATQLAHEIKDRFSQVDFPVARGAAQAVNKRDIQPNDAVLAMRDALLEAPLIIMAIGPATNVGILISLYPELSAQIESVVLVAGRRSIDHHFKVGPMHDPPFPDLNFDLDPEAFRIMIDHELPIHLLPFEISHKVWLAQQDMDQLATYGSAGKWLATHSQAWLTQWFAYGVKAYNPFDVLASGYIIDPHGFEFEDLPVSIIEHPDDTWVGDEEVSPPQKPYLILSSEWHGSYRIRYCHTPPPTFKADLFQLLST